MSIELSIAYVEFGGNTGDGRYFYGFSPDTFFASGKSVELEFKLGSWVGPEFEIVDIVATDDHAIADSKVRSDSRSATVTDQIDPQRRELINVSVVVRDSARNGALINCDPQVLNSPDPW
ncbi:MAG: hypothetical protein ABR550_11520 [Wenzhouxiangellaceae bacterium]